MFTLNNQLMMNYKKHLDVWDTNGKIPKDIYEELKHTVQLTSMNFHIAYEIVKMECKQESLNNMNLSVPPSMNDFNIWGDDRQKSIHKLIQFLLETAFQLCNEDDESNSPCFSISILLTLRTLFLPTRNT